MKLVMDEKVKHRLIGIAVIISIGAIFAPAIMKKSNQRLESNVSVNVKLPPKPVSPDVVMTGEKDMFKTIKIAKVSIPDVSDQKQLPETIQAEAIKAVAESSRVEVAALAPADKVEPLPLAEQQTSSRSSAKVATVSKPIKAVKPPPVIALKAKVMPKPKVKPQIVKRVARIIKPANKKEIYAVQLASFSQISNAQSLVSLLSGKGYKAHFTKVSGRNGAVYKVFVGHSPNRVDAMRLKVQLASAMQLRGFVVNTGVS